MTRGIYQDPQRYLDTYWSRWPDVWVHGDWASVEEIDGREEWFLHGRSDDTIKVAGKRLGPAEVESALVSHPAVVEAAAVGLPDERKGEQLWVYVVLARGARGRRRAAGASSPTWWPPSWGRASVPRASASSGALPKTRSAKVVRRVVRAVATDADPGDLSSLEDPATLDAIREAH